MARLLAVRGRTAIRSALCLATAAGLVAAHAADAHEVLHAVEGNRALAVKVYFADGGALAHARYEIYSPSDQQLPHQKGRTDRSGWLAFVPDVGGKWRVKVVDDTGHGLDFEIDAAAPGANGRALSPAPLPASSAAFVLRPLLGLTAIGAVFAILLAVHRRRGATR